MIRFDRPVLREEAGTPDGGGAPAAPSGPSKFDAILAQLNNSQQGAPPQGDPNGTQAPQGEDNAESGDPWEVKKAQKPKATSVTERIAAKREREATLPLQQQLTQLQQQQLRAANEQRARQAEIARRIQAGDVDGALKLQGLNLTFDEVQRQYLHSKGATQPPKDPHVARLEAQVRQIEQQRQAEEMAAREAQQRQAEAEQYQADLSAVAQEIASLPWPGAKELSELPGVNQAVLEILEKHQDMTLEDAARIARRDYAATFQLMQRVFEAQQQQQRGPQMPQYSAMQQRLAMGRRAPSAAGAPLPSVPKGLSGDAKFNEILKMVQNASR